jgi:tetratricopeptide (TPR) repeat protein
MPVTAGRLIELIKRQPDSLNSYVRLAEFLDARGQAELAIDHYHRLLQRQPNCAAAHFNIALLQKKIGDFDAALRSYEKALELEIADAHEVYSNLGVLYAEMHQSTMAESMYQKALKRAPDYGPALFNLAGLREEQGDRDAAVALYQRMLQDNPDHHDALVRLAYASKCSGANDPLIATLRDSITRAATYPLAQEGLYFALGKLMDDLGQYEKAFDAYRAANDLGKHRCRPYDPDATKTAFEQLIRLFDGDWIAKNQTDSVAAPIFICGMFRSGSTLVEHILAASPDFTAGGELDILPRLIAKKLSPYPNGAAVASVERLQEVSGAYLSQLQRLLPDARTITDKRPDNFLHIGLIKALFPKAKIIHTRRNALDNNLSIYFQQLDHRINYATQLENIAHYRSQHDRLMEHWQKCIGADICVIDYDELVRSPKCELQRLFAFLGVQWDDRYLSLEKSRGLVKTASIWQVRDRLYRSSSGRWKNYEKLASNSSSEVQKYQQSV